MADGAVGAIEGLLADPMAKLRGRVSRILADARVLSILEGSAEILAQMVARRRLGGSN